MVRLNIHTATGDHHICVTLNRSEGVIIEVHIYAAAGDGDLIGSMHTVGIAAIAVATDVHRAAGNTDFLRFHAVSIVFSYLNIQGAAGNVNLACALDGIAGDLQTHAGGSFNIVGVNTGNSHCRRCAGKGHLIGGVNTDGTAINVQIVVGLDGVGHTGIAVDIGHIQHSTVQVDGAAGINAAAIGFDHGSADGQGAGGKDGVLTAADGQLAQAADFQRTADTDATVSSAVGGRGGQLVGAALSQNDVQVVPGINAGSRGAAALVIIQGQGVTGVVGITTAGLTGVGDSLAGLEVMSIPQFHTVDIDIAGKEHIVIGGQVGISQAGQATAGGGGRAVGLHAALHVEVGAGVACQLHGIIAGVAGGVGGLDVAVAAVHEELSRLNAVSDCGDGQSTFVDSGIVGRTLNNDTVPIRIDGDITGLLPEVVLSDNAVGLTVDIQRTAADSDGAIGADTAGRVSTVTGGIDRTLGHGNVAGSENGVAGFGSRIQVAADGQLCAAFHAATAMAGGRRCNGAGLGKFHIAAGIDGIIAAAVDRQAAGAGELQGAGGADAVGIGGGQLVGAGEAHHQITLCIDSAGTAAAGEGDIVHSQGAAAVIEVAP